MYWSLINSEIKDKIKNCSKCADYNRNPPAEPLLPTPVPEPLLPTPVPDLPYAQVGTDIFTFQGRNYLLAGDYFSKFTEVDELKSMSAEPVIVKVKRKPIWPSRDFIQLN